VKNPRRASLRKSKVKGKGKGKGTSGKGTSGKAVASARGRSGSRPEPARIPVRGARKSQVRPRALADAPARARASAADLAETQALAVAAMEAALDKHAIAPVLIDVSGVGSYTDFIGIVSGRSDRQVDAIAENICQALKLRGRHLLGQEGTGSGRWTLLDFGAFVIHVFYHPVREFYDLESLWIEAPRVKLDVPPEAAMPQPDALYGAL
jgi:ribosome-associated protein